MMARIIPFPLRRPAGEEPIAKGEPATRRPVELELGPVGPAAAAPRRITVFCDDSLADLHEAITRLLGWDGTHNYFFSCGCSRYEDPALFGTQDRLAARCRKIYNAADTPLGAVIANGRAPLFYAYNLASSCELRITVCESLAVESVG